MSEIKARLAALRKAMEDRKVDACLFPTSDDHDSEYISDHYKTRAYLSGFTGSAGTLLVLKEEAGLWVDGRYFLQAAQQLEGSGIDEYKMGEPGVPVLEDFIEEKMGEGQRLMVDGRMISAAQGEDIRKRLEKKGAALLWEEDPLKDLWADRPALPEEPVWLLEQKYAGQPASEKLAAVRDAMAKEGAEYHLLSSLDDIAWLLNLRGSDIPYNPVALSFLLLGMKGGQLFIDEKKVEKELAEALEKDGIVLCPYGCVYDCLKALPEGTAVMAERDRINLALDACLAGKKVIDRRNPTLLLKAVKNPVEVENMWEAHRKDGAAFTKFMYWLKNKADIASLTECSAAAAVGEQRLAQPGSKGLSFETIAGYNSNGAIVHYSPKEGADKQLAPEGFLLMDCGGHYMEGSTDMTRTIALGPVPDEWKENFSLVLRSMLALGDIKFPEGVSGMQLDVIAREPFWSRGLNYRHGTGHGIGYLLNVHEGPNSFRFQPRKDESNWKFAPGMITSDEPGIYIEGSHGIRLENLVLCVEKEVTEYGRFLGFEHMTLAPIDLDAVDVKYLDEKDLDRLNRYHKKVFEELAPRLTDEEAAWLKEYTCPLTK